MRQINNSGVGPNGKNRGNLRLSSISTHMPLKRARASFLPMLICLALVFGCAAPFTGCAAQTAAYGQTVDNATQPGNSHIDSQTGAAGANAAENAGAADKTWAEKLSLAGILSSSIANVSVSGAGIAAAAVGMAGAAAATAGPDNKAQPVSPVNETQQVSLDGLTILAINSSLAVIRGELTDLSVEYPGLQAYLRDNRTFIPAEFMEKSFGLESVYNEKRGTYRLKKGAEILISLDYMDYDFTFGQNGETILFIPLRRAVESLGMTISYYDGLLVICEGQAPFEPSGDATQLSALRAALTGAVPVGSAERFTKLMQSSGLYPYSGVNVEKMREAMFPAGNSADMPRATTSPQMGWDVADGGMGFEIDAGPPP